MKADKEVTKYYASNKTKQLKSDLVGRKPGKLYGNHEVSFCGDETPFLLITLWGVYVVANSQSFLPFTQPEIMASFIAT